MSENTLNPQEEASYEAPLLLDLEAVSGFCVCLTGGSGGDDGGGGGGGGGGCFLAGTMVNTGRGTYLPIQDLKVGDTVLSFNEESGQLEGNAVLKLYRTEQPRYYVLNQSIRTTAPHPFLVNGDWKAVRDIRVGDRLRSIDAESVHVESIEVVEEPVPVFNLTVDRAHTYFVHDTLVHNKPEG